MKHTFTIAALVSFAAAQTASVLANASMPIETSTVVYVYLDPECACHKTSTTSWVPAAMPTTYASGPIPTSTYTWYETECGCTKSAAVPMYPSGIPTMSPNATTPWTAPSSPTATMTPSASELPAPYTGAAAAMEVVSWGVVALFGLFGLMMV